MTRRRSSPGLTHVTPFSKILFVKFGPNGNLHQPRGYAPGIIEDPKDAEQSVRCARTCRRAPLMPWQFTVTSRALLGDGLNVLTQSYLAWLMAIEEKVRV